MSPPVPSSPADPPHSAAPSRAYPARQIRPGEALAAASRLVSQAQPDVEAAAARLLTVAPGHGIDLDLIFATFEPVARPTVRQAVLAVPGSGRTAMLFISEPPRGGDPGGPDQGIHERAECIRLACECLSTRLGDRVQIAQSLPEPREAWAIRSAERAGFRSVGDLGYLRRPLAERLSDSGPILDPDLDVQTVSQLNAAAQDADALLVDALGRSYEDTLDCPELCGLRSTRDILDSHKATGTFDPALWWVVRIGSEAHGCCLLSRCPEQRTIELVYLGLSRHLRGRGLAKRLLCYAMGVVKATNPGWAVVCAVDQRNAPARKLYGSLGFREFAQRRALVKPLP